jgi:hypothetical protein
LIIQKYKEAKVVILISIGTPDSSRGQTIELGKAECGGEIPDEMWRASFSSYLRRKSVSWI